jgi:mannose-6-phosphate isomerase class I
VTLAHRSGRAPNYDRFPSVPVGTPGECDKGWDDVVSRLRGVGARVIAIEAYPGVHDKDLARLVDAIDADGTVDVTDALRPDFDQLVAPFVTDDPVFGYVCDLTLPDLFDPAALESLRDRVRDARGTVVVYGLGASLLVPEGMLVLADMPRWESQLRMRRGAFANIGAPDRPERWQAQYKRAYFVDWRIADRHKQQLLERVDFVLDTTQEEPVMIAGETLRRALHATSSRPFRVVPYFDPAPWGGQWMKEVCDLPRDTPNYGWCFDCVPEENSLLLGFGQTRFETPALNLVMREPRGLLGDEVVERFGAEFPIRFDFLDTIDGGTLSLQVHPPTEYIRDTFGMTYTQDESYYIMDAEPDAGVFLGVRDNVDRDEMLAALRRAEAGGEAFDAERYVNLFPARKHDHLLVPAGTIHCSRRCMVLEISATPYIFTFKLWDWDRPGLDGHPRPVHIDHGANAIQWDRDTGFARRELINRFEQLAAGEGWVEERTGLHPAEFIETRRHWFTGTVPHARGNGVEVLNLVEGEAAIVESPDRAFEPFAVHYAETFIVPAAAGPYTITPHGLAEGTRCATIKAFVRR